MALNPKISDWRGKRVWVVGASTGIGLALAERLSAQGARIVMSARNVSRLQAAADSVPGAVAVPLDVSDASAWPGAEAQARSALGGIDVVVLNAGTYAPLRAWDLATPAGLATARQTFETNLMGVYGGLSACLPDMLARGSGHVVIVGSVAGYGGLPKAVAYGPGKAALINLAESLYIDLAPRGIAVTIVSPGFVETPLTAQNDFHMPALITAAQAADNILRGLRAGRFEIHFPWRFSGFLKCLGLLPRWAYFRLVGRLA
ncbi:SDR family NAD(P)-dependent oxidoreductase [Viridibacterium curvum]|uniref:SDR family NAD(P)-dependent oxidoreductase n=1 Tax=Viridibacterium curvum TaxID=1101404 RepID=A0ABP9QVS0_9RHOO